MDPVTESLPESKAPAMPRTVMVLLGLMLVDVGLLIANLSDTSSVLGLGWNAVMLYGFLKGNELVRMYMSWGAFVGVIFGAAALVTAAGVGSPLLMITGVWTTATCAFTLVVLRDEQVQTWMLSRALGGAVFDD